MSNSIFSQFGTYQGATSLAIFIIIVLTIFIAMRITNLPLLKLGIKLFHIITKFVGKIINKKEENYHRDLAIGKITEKRRAYKSYNFLNDLVIDLGFSTSDVTPYELFFVTAFLTFCTTMILCKMVFGNFIMGIIMFPLALIGIMCVMYTRANVAHDKRIEEVIEAENIICNNIKAGVVVAVRESLDVLPKDIKPEFVEFIDNIEQQNYHIKTALLELNSKLGSVSDDFIKKCIVLEMEEEHGIVGMFQDIVEVNNINMEMRTSMKRAFEQIIFRFKIGAGMIFTFLAGVLFVYPTVRSFYLNTVPGNLLLAVDALIIILEFVYITSLRAKELS